MQHRKTKSRPVAIQSLESRRLMSAWAPFDPPVPWVEGDHAMYGMPGDVGHGPPGGFAAAPVDAGATAVPTAVAVQADATAVVPDTAASLAQDAAPVVATATPIAQAVFAGGDGSVLMTTTSVRDTTAVAEWARPWVSTSAPVAPMAAPAVVAAAAVAAAAAGVEPVATVGSVDRTPFVTGAAPDAPATRLIGGGVADVTVPASVGAVLSVTDVPLGGAVTAAAPSFGATVIEGARAAHPLAAALAAAASIALWVSTESARDRRREQVSRTVTDAAAEPSRLVTLGLFRA
jgi:hypothetical protein